jgi:hypothetical protein
MVPVRLSRMIRPSTVVALVIDGVGVAHPVTRNRRSHEGASAVAVSTHALAVESRSATAPAGRRPDRPRTSARRP